MPKDRCSFEVVYAKNERGIEEIEHVIIRGGLSDATVTLTIPQVCNLARLLDIVQTVNERNSNGNGVTALPPGSPQGGQVPRRAIPVNGGPRND
jgi:hypothetical protein